MLRENKTAGASREKVAPRNYELHLGMPSKILRLYVLSFPRFYSTLVYRLTLDSSLDTVEVPNEIVCHRHLILDMPQASQP